MIEEAAKEKFCPITKTSCRASECMFWHDTTWRNPNPESIKCEKRGYCEIPTTTNEAE